MPITYDLWVGVPSSCLLITASLYVADLCEVAGRQVKL